MKNTKNDVSSLQQLDGEKMPSKDCNISVVIMIARGQ